MGLCLPFFFFLLVLYGLNDNQISFYRKIAKIIIRRNRRVQLQLLFLFNRMNNFVKYNDGKMQGQSKPFKIRTFSLSKSIHITSLVQFLFDKHEIAFDKGFFFFCETWPPNSDIFIISKWWKSNQIDLKPKDRHRVIGYILNKSKRVPCFQRPNTMKNILRSIPRIRTRNTVAITRRIGAYSTRMMWEKKKYIYAEKAFMVK